MRLRNEKIPVQLNGFRFLQCLFHSQNVTFVTTKVASNIHVYLSSNNSKFHKWKRMGDTSARQWISAI